MDFFSSNHCLLVLVFTGGKKGTRKGSVNKKTLEKLNTDAEAYFKRNPAKLTGKATKTQRAVTSRNGQLSSRPGTRLRNKRIGET